MNLLNAGKEEDLLGKAYKLHEVLRPLDGVKHVQPIAFKSWLPDRVWNPKEDPDWNRFKGQAPWLPYGVLIIVESKSPDGLDRNISEIYSKAQIVDPDVMRIRPLGMNGH